MNTWLYRLSIVAGIAMVFQPHVVLGATLQEYLEVNNKLQQALTANKANEAQIQLNQIYQWLIQDQNKQVLQKLSAELRQDANNFFNAQQIRIDKMSGIKMPVPPTFQRAAARRLPTLRRVAAPRPPEFLLSQPVAPCPSGAVMPPTPPKFLTEGMPTAPAFLLQPPAQQLPARPAAPATQADDYKIAYEGFDDAEVKVRQYIKADNIMSAFKALEDVEKFLQLLMLFYARDEHDAQKMAKVTEIFNVGNMNSFLQGRRGVASNLRKSIEDKTINIPKKLLKKGITVAQQQEILKKLEEDIEEEKKLRTQPEVEQNALFQVFVVIKNNDESLYNQLSEKLKHKTKERLTRFIESQR